MLEAITFMLTKKFPNVKFRENMKRLVLRFSRSDVRKIHALPSTVNVRFHLFFHELVMELSALRILCTQLRLKFEVRTSNLLHLRNFSKFEPVPASAHIFTF